MRKTNILPLALLMCFILSQCAENISEKSVYIPTIDSLLNMPNPNQPKITRLNRIENLDLMKGYRGLVLGMSIDSINIGYDGIFDSTYKSKGIIIIEKIKPFIDLLDTDCRVTLTFYKDLLAEVKFYSFVYTLDLKNHPGVEMNPKYSIYSPLSKLKEMFGSPTTNRTIERKKLILTDKQSYRTVIDCDWEYLNTKINYQANFNFYDETVSELIIIEPIYIDVSITLSDTRFNTVINSSKKTIDDSLKIVSENIAKQKFIKDF